MDADPKGVAPVEHSDCADPFNHLRDAFAVDEFHRHPDVISGLTGVVDSDDVGVSDRVHRLHRPDEALHFFFVGREFRQQHLECHVPILLGIGPMQHDAGGALREDSGDLVVVDLCADQGFTAADFRSCRCGLGSDGRLAHARPFDPQLCLADLDHVAGSDPGFTGG